MWDRRPRPVSFLERWMSKAVASPNTPVPLALAKLATLSGVAALILSVGLYVGAVQLGATLRLAGASTTTTPIELRIGLETIAIPANAVRFPEQRSTQTQKEVDLYLQWPAMTGFDATAEETFHDPEARNLLFLRLTAADPRPADGEASTLQAPVTAGPAGLLRSSRAGLPGIASEEAVYRAPAGRDPAYEVSCLDGKDAVMAADCIREVQFVPGLRLRYRFSHALLPQWDRIDHAVLAYLAEHRRS